MKNQLTHVLRSVFTSHLQHNKLSLFALLIYVATAFALFGLVAYLILENQALFQQAILTYLFPESWHFVVERLAGFFFESQSKMVIAAFMSSSALVFISVVLFPLKEWCSRVFEVASGNPIGEANELSLSQQIKEEGKLLFFYITVQMVILALGYYPYLWCQVIAVLLSVLFLCFSFSLDFLAPLLQRHAIKYSAMIVFLIKHPVLSLGFGAVFALPILLISRLIVGIEAITPIEMGLSIFAISIIFLTLAITSGTRLAMDTFEQINAVKALSANVRKVAYSGLAAVCAAGAIFHGALLLSLHHKSQLLKCHYDIHWTEVKFESSSILGMFKDSGKMVLSIPMAIHNPTVFDVYIEESTFVFTQNTREVARMALSELNVPAGNTITQRLDISVDMAGKSLSGWRELAHGWQIHMQFDVLPGIPFIVQLK